MSNQIKRNVSRKSNYWRRRISRLPYQLPFGLILILALLGIVLNSDIYTLYLVFEWKVDCIIFIFLVGIGYVIIDRNQDLFSRNLKFTPEKVSHKIVGSTLIVWISGLLFFTYIPVFAIVNSKLDMSHSEKMVFKIIGQNESVFIVHGGKGGCERNHIIQSDRFLLQHQFKARCSKFSGNELIEADVHRGLLGIPWFKEYKVIERNQPVSTSKTDL